MKLISVVPASFVLGLVACGPSYPLGTVAIQAETTGTYYPKPEVAYTPENLAIVAKNANAIPGCNVQTADGTVSALCGGSTYIAGKNGQNPKVISIVCLGKLDNAGIEACITMGMKLVAGAK